MHLKLMFITNDPQTARIAQAAGVDRIFVDMEALGKAERQGGMDTVQSHHTAADAARLRPLLDRAELLVRVDPIHDGSQEQIEAVLRAGADVVMLPFFRTAGEVAAFTRIVGGRARTCLLVETPGGGGGSGGVLPGWTPEEPPVWKKRWPQGQRRRPRQPRSGLRQPKV